jgi:hypothetical protein
MARIMKCVGVAIPLSFVTLVLGSGCARTNEPLVETWTNGAFQSIPILDYTISGQRHGAQTTALAVFTLEHGEHLRIKMEIIYDPTPALASSHWEFDGTGGGSGDAQAESLKFLGGQGEGPSLGGRFRLDENGSPRFRVVLPPRPVESPKW